MLDILLAVTFPEQVSPGIACAVISASVEQVDCRHNEVADIAAHIVAVFWNSFFSIRDRIVSFEQCVVFHCNYIECQLDDGRIVLGSNLREFVFHLKLFLPSVYLLAQSTKVYLPCEKYAKGKIEKKTTLSVSGWFSRNDQSEFDSGCPLENGFIVASNSELCCAQVSERTTAPEFGVGSVDELFCVASILRVANGCKIQPFAIALDLRNVIFLEGVFRGLCFVHSLNSSLCEYGLPQFLEVYLPFKKYASRSVFADILLCHIFQI